MKLEHPFYQLPVRYDVEQLAGEMRGLGDEDWIAHPDGFPGNASVPLVSVGGGINNDFCGAMAATPTLMRLPYTQQVIASFGEIVGRSRLMRLAPGYTVPPHTDTNYHWYKRVRIHIPIVSDAGVVFHCRGQQATMAPGEAWILDTWHEHHVENNGATLRVHLVVDITGSSRFWSMVRGSAFPGGAARPAADALRLLPFQPGRQARILLERFNAPTVMHPGEMDGWAAEILRDAESVAENRAEDLANLTALCAQLCQDWRCLWSIYGEDAAGWGQFDQLRRFVMNKVRALNEDFLGSNGVPVKQILDYCLLQPALAAPPDSSN
jgi:hypothetical protein